MAGRGTPQAASVPQSGVSLHNLHSGDLNLLQSVQRDYENQQKTKKDYKSETMGLLQFYCEKNVVFVAIQAEAPPGILGPMKKYHTGPHHHRPHEPWATAVTTSPGPN